MDNSLKYQLIDYITDIEDRVHNNTKYEYKFSADTVEKIFECIEHLKTSTTYIKCLNKLYSGDYGEDSFLQNLNNNFNEIN